MAEYISKDYALYVVNYFGNMLTWSKEDVIAEIKRNLEKETAVDVVKVKHGKWNKKRNVFFGKYYNCSICNANFGDSPYPLPKYCPNCGAKMDGGNNEL